MNTVCIKFHCQNLHILFEKFCVTLKAGYKVLKYDGELLEKNENQSMCENMDAQAHSMKGKGGPDYPRIMYFDIFYNPPPQKKWKI